MSQAPSWLAGLSHPHIIHSGSTYPCLSLPPLPLVRLAVVVHPSATYPLPCIYSGTICLALWAEIGCPAPLFLTTFPLPWPNGGDACMKKKRNDKIQQVHLHGRGVYVG